MSLIWSVQMFLKGDMMVLINLILCLNFTNYLLSTYFLSIKPINVMQSLSVPKQLKLLFKLEMEIIID